MNNLLLPGTKIYRWLSTDDGNQLEVCRLAKVTDDFIKIKHCDTGTTEKLNKDELEKRSYTILRPDAYVGFSVVSLNGMEDVEVTIYRKKEIDEKSPLPYCVCRQSITDFYSNALAENMNYVGVCVSQDTLPENVSMESVLACDSVVLSTSVAAYINDTLNDILRFVNSKPYDLALYNLFMDHVKYNAKTMGGKIYISGASKKDNVDGYCKTLKGLLEYNDMMYDFHQGFNIFQLDIDLADNSEENTSLLHMVLSGILRKNVDSTFVLPYDHDIDLKSVERNYVLVSDKSENLYLVAYTYSGKYHIPVEDIETPENVVSMYNVIHPSEDSSLAEAYKYVRLNSKKYSDKL